MTFAELKTTLSGVLPDKVAYYQWPVGEAPPLPYMVYYSLGADNFAADNVVYDSRRDVRIELYSRLKDLATEGALEAALTAAGLFWTREETYIDDEHVYETIYEVTI